MRGTRSRGAVEPARPTAAEEDCIDLTALDDEGARAAPPPKRARVAPAGSDGDVVIVEAPPVPPVARAARHFGGAAGAAPGGADDGVTVLGVFGTVRRVLRYRAAPRVAAVQGPRRSPRPDTDSAG